MSQCENSYNDVAMTVATYVEVQSQPMDVEVEQVAPRKENLETIRFHDYHQSYHKHDNWIKVMTNTNKTVMNPIKTDYLTTTAPAFTNVIRKLTEDRERRNNVFVTCVAFVAKIIFVGFNTGLMRKYSPSSLEVLPYEISLPGPIYEIVPVAFESAVLIIANKKLWVYYLHRGFHSIVKHGISTKTNFVNAFITHLSVFVMSQNGKLYSVNIQDGITHLREKVKIVDHCINVQSLKADENDDKGIILSIQCCKSVLIVRVFITDSFKKEFPNENWALSCEKLGIISMENWKMGLSYVLTPNKLILKSFFKHAMIENDREYGMLEYRDIPTFNNIRRKIMLCSEKVKFIEYCEDNLIIVQNKEIILILDIKTLNFKYFIQLPMKPMKVLFYKEYLIITYENNVMQIQSLECYTDHYPCTKCLSFFKQYFNFDVRTKQGEQYYCEHFFKFKDDDWLRMKPNDFNN